MLRTKSSWDLTPNTIKNMAQVKSAQMSNDRLKNANATSDKFNNRVLKINMDYEILNIESVSQYAYKKAIKDHNRLEMVDSLKSEWIAGIVLGNIPYYNGHRMTLNGERVYYILDLLYFNDWPWLFMPEGHTSAEKVHINADIISVCYGDNIELRIDDSGIWVMSAHLGVICEFLKALLYKNLKIKVDPIIKSVDLNEYYVELNISK